MLLPSSGRSSRKSNVSSSFLTIIGSISRASTACFGRYHRQARWVPQVIQAPEPNLFGFGFVSYRDESRADVQALDLSSSGFLGSPRLCSAVFAAPQFSALLTLCLNSCPVTTEASERLAAAVGTMPALRDFSAARCGLTAAAVAPLVAALGGLDALERIELGENADLKDDGAAVVASGLAPATTLQVLGLSGIGAGSTGMGALAALFAGLPVLASIDVSYNPVDAASARALTAALRQCTALQHVALQTNDLPPGIQNELKAAFAATPNLLFGVLADIPNPGVPQELPSVTDLFHSL